MLARLWYSRGMRRDVPILSHKPVTRSRDELIARWSVLALMAVGLAYTAALVAGIAPDNFDAHSYWMADLADPYARSRVGTDYAYLYSPAFAQAIEPLRWLPWTIAGAIWTIGLFGLLGWTAGRLGLVLLLFQPVVASIALGNVEIPIAAAIVAGFRWPAAWSFVLLSKVTPGIGLLWFAVRREWCRHFSSPRQRSRGTFPKPKSPRPAGARCTLRPTAPHPMPNSRPRRLPFRRPTLRTSN